MLTDFQREKFSIVLELNFQHNSEIELERKEELRLMYVGALLEFKEAFDDESEYLEFIRMGKLLFAEK